MSWIFAAPLDDDVRMRERAREALAGRPPGYLDAHELRDATARHGADLATAMAYEAFVLQPANAAFLERLSAVPAAAVQAGGRVAIIPTMYYQERPELGGDGRLIRGIAERFGAHVDTVSVASLGRVDDNAGIVADYLDACEEPVWMVAISKGAADLKRALVRRPELCARLAGLLIVAGMPGGTPLADPRPGRPVAHALMQGWLLLRGGSAGMLAEMGREHAYSRARLELPATLPVINIVPMPLSSHLRKPVDRGASFLARSGPNDGYVLLEDALILPGRVVPIWGADHYLRVPQLCDALYRILRIVLAGG